MTGCATMERSRVAHGPREASFVFDPATTPLGQALLPQEALHPGQSGFGLVSYGLEALVARTAIVDGASRSLDVQYYIYAADQAGSLFMQHLIQAAQRGVRVRLLLDDFNLRDDGELATLAAVPNFQIRIFNPVSFRARWARLPEYALSFGRADRRMHNKLLIGDNAVGILGGRNIADHYFSLEEQDNFRDFDLLAEGPVVRAASTAFDEYWNSPYAVPVGEIIHRRENAASMAALMGRLAARAKPAQGFEKRYEALRPHYLPDLFRSGELVWAQGEIVTDSPGRVSGDGGATDSVADRLNAEFDRAQKEVLVEAAYFLPGEEGMRRFEDMRRRGVKVKLLTCALATTDVPMVYLAYSKYRRPLLESGVDLYEYRLIAPGVKRSKLWYHSGYSETVLHSKAIVFDQKRIWIGSLNLDPRSMRLNTEIAAVVDSEVLAQRLAADMFQDMAPDRSWQVELVPRGGTGGGEGVVWIGEQNGKRIVRTHEPASWLRRLDSLLLSVLPGIEDQL
ncbi:MAG TPA: phospholipase D family protein [Opitutaceae bacterium]